MEVLFLSDNKQFVVYVTELTPENEAKLSNLIGIDNIKFLKCTYSYNQLNDIKTQIDDFLVPNLWLQIMENLARALLQVQIVL